MKNKFLILFIIALFGFLNIRVSEAQYSRLVVSLSGMVKDATSNQPVDITMELYDANGQIKDKKHVKAANNGKYFLTGLKPGGTYTIRFKSDDFLIQEYTMSIPNTDKYAEFSRDFLVKPKKVGAKIKFQVPPFELNKTKLRAGSNFFLKDNIELLKRNRTVKVQLICYPDHDKDSATNQQMTAKRCESLKDFFVANGIAPERISLKPESTTDPDNPPPTEMRAKGKRYIGSIYFVIEQI